MSVARRLQVFPSVVSHTSLNVLLSLYPPISHIYPGEAYETNEARDRHWLGDPPVTRFHGARLFSSAFQTSLKKSFDEPLPPNTYTSDFRVTAPNSDLLGQEGDDCDVQCSGNGIIMSRKIVYGKATQAKDGIVLTSRFIRFQHVSVVLGMLGIETSH